MQSPFFSVIIPTYNRAHLIGKTIQSVIGQHFSDWELLIIDDGSSDNTKEVVLGFNDERIKYNWQQNQERSAARNNGINLASGQFICFLDSDDIWFPIHLEKLFKKIAEENQKQALYFTGMRWVFPDYQEDIIFPSPVGKNPFEYVITYQIAPSTACIPTSLLKNQKFNTNIRINEDVELFSRIVLHAELIQVPEITIDFIIHNENTRSLHKDYIGPQIEVMRMIFDNPDLKNRISPQFKNEIFRKLRHQYINFYYQSGQFSKMNLEIIRYLASYPADPQNKAKVVLLLYNLPGGKLLQKLIGLLKR